MSVILTPTDGGHTTLAINSLNGLANSTNVGWQSAVVSNNVLRASDFKLYLQFATQNTPPSGNKAMYVYVIPWFYDGIDWSPGGDGGTMTLPSGVDSSYAINTPNNLGMPIAVLNYTTDNQPMRKIVKLSNKFSALMPQGWSLFILNSTGATLAVSGNTIIYTPVTYVSV